MEHQNADINGRFRLEQHLGEGALGEVYRVASIRAKAAAPEDALKGRGRTAASVDVTGMTAEIIAPDALDPMGGVHEVVRRLRRLVGREHPLLLQCMDADRVQGGPAEGNVFVLTRRPPNALQFLLDASQPIELGMRRRLVGDLLKGASFFHQLHLVHGFDTKRVYLDNVDGWMLGPAFLGESLEPVDAARRDLPALCELARAIDGEQVAAIEHFVEDMEVTGGRHPTVAEVYLNLSGAESPEAVTSLEVAERTGLEAMVDWVSVATGRVQLVDAGSNDVPPPGTEILATDLPALGVAFSSSSRPVPVTIPPDKMLRVLAVTVRDDCAVIGCLMKLGPLEEVIDLRWTPVGEQVRLTWAWPDGVTNARIAWRRDKPPVHAEDPKAMHLDVTKDGRFAREGGGVKIQDRAARYITVFAMAYGMVKTRRRDGRLFSSGSSLTIGRGFLTAVRYRVHVPRMGRPTLTVRTSRPGKLPGLILIHSDEGDPNSAGDGVRVLSIKEGTPCLPEEPLVLGFDVAKGRRSGFKLFSSNPASKIELRQDPS